MDLSEKTAEISSLFDDVDKKLQSHDSKLQEIFDQLTSKIENIIMILNWMSMEFFDAKTFFYYFLLTFISILITSFQTLYPSRAYVLLCNKFKNSFIFLYKIVILCNFTVERLFASANIRSFFGFQLYEYHFAFIEGVFLLRY